MIWNNQHDNSVGQELLLSLFHRWRIWSLEGLTNVSQLVSGKVRTFTSETLTVNTGEWELLLFTLRTSRNLNVIRRIYIFHRNPLNNRNHKKGKYPNKEKENAQYKRDKDILQGSASFSCKGSDVNILRFVSQEAKSMTLCSYFYNKIESTFS